MTNEPMERVKGVLALEARRLRRLEADPNRCPDCGGGMRDNRCPICGFVYEKPRKRRRYPYSHPEP